MSKPQRNSDRVINNATTWALSVFESDLSPTQKLICLYLRTHMNSYQEIAWPSKARIAAKCGITERAVYNNMPKICESGYLIANGTGPNGTIRYEICTPELGSPLNYVPNTPERGSPELTKELTNSISKGFKRPSLDDVTTYCEEKGYSVDAETFINHYESNGWKVGRASMKSWQAALANWNKRNKQNGKAKQNTNNGRKLSGAERTRIAREEARRRQTGG